MNEEKDYTNYYIFAFAVVAYLIYQEIKASKQAGAEQKILTDENYNLASQLHSAFHIGLISDYIDTVDEQALYSVASKIKDWDGVQKAYKDLYSETLISRIQQVFQDTPEKANLFYAKVKNASGLNSNSSALPTVGKLTVGRTAVAYSLLNALDYQDSTKVLKQFKPSEEVGKYLGDYPKLIKGVRYAVVEISYYAFWTKKALILKDRLITY